MFCIVGDGKIIPTIFYPSASKLPPIFSNLFKKKKYKFVMKNLHKIIPECKIIF